MMPRNEQHTGSVPFGTLGIIPLKSFAEMGKKIDECLVRWRSEREGNRHFPSIKGQRCLPCFRGLRRSD